MCNLHVSVHTLNPFLLDVDPAVAGLQKQIDDIIQELNLLKENQALQAGKVHIVKTRITFPRRQTILRKKFK